MAFLISIKYCRVFVRFCGCKEMGKFTYYAVAIGRKTGIFHSWSECEQQVKGFVNSRHKGFNSLELAEKFISSGISSNNDNNKEKRIAGRKHGIPDSTRSSSSSSSSLSSSMSSESSSTASSSLHGKKRCVEDVERVDTNGKKRCVGDVVEVYTDGACSNNGQRGALAGVGVYWGPNHEWNYSAPLEGIQTNQRAELQAIIDAVSIAKNNEIKTLKIYTDSAFCINAMEKWISGWKKNGWKTASGTDVKNNEKFKYLDELIKGMEIIWVHVRGHTGIHGNEEADRLACEGVKMHSK